MMCDRCGNEATVSTMSMFNTQMICMECKTREEQRPDYDDARKADEDAIRSGNYNYKGIGLK